MVRMEDRDDGEGETAWERMTVVLYSEWLEVVDALSRSGRSEPSV